MEPYRIPPSRRPALRIPIIALAVVAFVALFLVRWGASLLIDYEWWKELGQVHTWIDYYSYQTVPVTIGVILATVVLWLAHGRAVKFSRTELKEYPLYSKLSLLGALLL